LPDEKVITPVERCAALNWARDFEGAAALEILRFEEKIGATALVGGLRRQHRRDMGDTRQASSGLDDV
jgi:hypothetical protein